MIYTMGYTGRNHEEIRDLLKELRVHRLIDCRLVPFSRAPMWQKRAFQVEHPNMYVHYKGFGNENYKSPMNGVRLHNPELHLADVRQFLKGTPIRNIMLMCACADWVSCHRVQVAHWICDQLGLEPDTNIVHMAAPSKEKVRKSKKSEGDSHQGVLPPPQLKLSFE